MTGRPHLARSARQPARPWDTGLASARERCARAAALPRSRSSRPGGAAARGHLAPAYHRFSVPQDRPPHPGRWRRDSGCKEAFGLTQRNLSPRRRRPRGSACSALAGKGRRGTACCARGAEGHGGRSGRRTGATPPPACHMFNTPLTSLQKKKKTNPP